MSHIPAPLPWKATLRRGRIGAGDRTAIEENTTDAPEARLWITSIWWRAQVSSRFCFCNQVITDGNNTAVPIGKSRQCGLAVEAAQQWEMPFELWEISVVGSGCQSSPSAAAQGLLQLLAD